MSNLVVCFFIQKPKIWLERYYHQCTLCILLNNQENSCQMVSEEWLLQYMILQRNFAMILISCYAIANWNIKRIKVVTKCKPLESIKANKKAVILNQIFEARILLPFLSSRTPGQCYLSLMKNQLHSLEEVSWSRLPCSTRTNNKRKETATLSLG